MPSRFDNWYLAQLRPGAFERARINLDRQGFACFMPLRARTIRRSGRLQPVRHPLFPGYIFVQIDPGSQGWRKINSTFGVARLVSLEPNRPTPVPPEVMEGLFARCDADTWHMAPQDLQPGHPARLVQGPFCEMMAVVETVPEKDRVFVLLDLMGRTTRVGVALDDLEPVAAAPGSGAAATGDK